MNKLSIELTNLREKKNEKIYQYHLEKYAYIIGSSLDKRKMRKIIKYLKTTTIATRSKKKKYLCVRKMKYV